VLHRTAAGRESGESVNPDFEMARNQLSKVIECYNYYVDRVIAECQGDCSVGDKYSRFSRCMRWMFMRLSAFILKRNMQMMHRILLAQ
jgi:hypothetical protein